jgi:amino acid transporter
MPKTETSRVTAALARDRLGVPAVLFFVMSGVAPLTVAAGVVTTAYAVTGLTAIPAAFLATALVLALFSVGYVAMARHNVNSGAFYAFATRGLGRPMGIAVAMVALAAYNMLQTGLYGAFGPGLAGYAQQHFGLSAPWWAWALGAWTVVAILGLLKVDLNGRVLAVLLTAEVVAVLALTVAGLTHPAGGLSQSTLAPTNLAHSGVGALLAIAVLGFVGFEGAAVFSEEARHPRRTVPVATYLSLGLIAVVYAAASWAMAVHYGEGNLAATAQQQGPGMLFAMGGRFLDLASNTLFLTSLFAAMLAFHSFVTRYMFVLGREGVLPRALARTSAAGSPKSASMVQSLLGLTVIVTYAVAGWDPLVRLFFWLGTTGGFGILILLAVTSVVVIGFFARNPCGESAWHRIVAPGLAAAVLTGMVWLAVDNYATLLGVPPGSPAARWLPLVFVLAAAVGLVWAVGLRLTRPDVYAAVGSVPKAATSRPGAPDTRDWPIANPSAHWSGVQL